MKSSARRWMIAAFATRFQWNHHTTTRIIQQKQQQQQQQYSRQRQRQSSSATSSIMTLSVSLDKYLEETLAAVDPTYTMPLNRQLIKFMMRALLEIDTKVEFEQRLRTFIMESQYQATQQFVHDYWPQLQSVVSNEDAPQFQQGVSMLEHFSKSPRKFFSYVARGRVYQGKFERLLQDVQEKFHSEFSLSMQSAYRDIFREEDEYKRDAAVEADLLRRFARQQTDTTDNHDDDNAESSSSLLYQDLLACINLNYPGEGPWQPADGGYASGKRGEAELMDYLIQQQQYSINETNENDASTTRIVSPVFLQVRNKAKMAKKCLNVIELPDNVDLHGVTSELDAVVLRVHKDNYGGNGDDTSVTLLQVWEAKATLNPSRLQDALTKKYRTISTIMTNACAIVIDGTERFAIDNSNSNSTNGKITLPAPRLGIFGSSLSSPKSAARQTQVIIADEMLATDPDFVRHVLKTGYISVPTERVENAIQRVLDLVREIQPITVLSNEVEVVQEDDGSK